MNCAMSQTNPGKWTKRKAKKARQGNTKAMERSVQQLSVIVLNITAMEVGLVYTSLNFL